jgi:hypothetical protein
VGPRDPSVKPYWDKDAYTIYAILLEDEKRSFVEIQSETNASPHFAPESMVSGGDPGFYKTWGPGFKDYAKQNRVARILTRDFPVTIPYKLANEPSGNRFIWFSSVGFNPQRTFAVVTMGHESGISRADWRPYFFKKMKGQWEWVAVEAQTGGWQS